MGRVRETTDHVQERTVRLTCVSLQKAWSSEGSGMTSLKCWEENESRVLYLLNYLSAIKGHYCAPETGITLCINFTRIKTKLNKKQKREKEDIPREKLRTFITTDLHYKNAKESSSGQSRTLESYSNSYKEIKSSRKGNRMGKHKQININMPLVCNSPFFPAWLKKQVHKTTITHQCHWEHKV